MTGIIAIGELATIAALLIAAAISAAWGRQTLTMSGAVVLALLHPGNFVTLLVVWVVLVMGVRIVMSWVDWLKV